MKFETVENLDEDEVYELYNDILEDNSVYKISAEGVVWVKCANGYYARPTVAQYQCEYYFGIGRCWNGGGLGEQNVCGVKSGYTCCLEIENQPTVWIKCANGYYAKPTVAQYQCGYYFGVGRCWYGNGLGEQNVCGAGQGGYTCCIR